MSDSLFSNESLINRQAFGCCFSILLALAVTPQPAFAKPVDTRPVEDASAKDAQRRPNIIVIYTDDQGYGDVSAINSEAKFETPHLDRLAKEGVAFTNAHSADSVCTPSRYGLLTGRYPWRTTMKRSVLGAEAKCLIADGRMTLATLLRDSGYQTAMVGKWHLGMDFPGQVGNRDWQQPTLGMPLDHGFDYFYGIPASLNYGVLAWFENRHAAVPPTLYSNKKPNPRHSDYRIMPPYDQTADGPGRFIQRKGFEIAPDFIDNQCLTRFTDKAIEWMQSKVTDAKSGKPFFLYLPYTSPHFPVCPLPEFHGQGECGAYGEFMIETDHHIGRVLDFLKTSDLDGDTLIVFSSDNGPENPWKEHLRDFGHDSRGGFRGGKRSVYEGGHRVPFMVRWPNGIQSVDRQHDGLVGQVDLLATVADLVGVSLPANAGEDSQSFLPVLVNSNQKSERLPLINHANGGREYRYSITAGDWKLILPTKKQPAELYQLGEDPSETNNLAGKHPDVVERLTHSANKIICNGRTTPGPRQSNDTGHWTDLEWITPAEFRKQAGQQRTGRSL